METDAHPFDDSDTTVPSDDTMRAMLARAITLTTVILREGPRADAEDARALVWEHGRRNFRLRDQGLLRIVCPMSDDTDVCGIGIFAAPVERVIEIMDEDPGVRAGVFVYEAHPCRSFPGDALPS